MKILFFENEEWEKDYFKRALSDDELVFVDDKLTAASIPSDTDAEAISVFVYSKIDEAVFKKFPNLKFISTRSTGFDHIDLEEALERNIAVSNVPTYGENTVAEFTFTLLLALSRKVYDAYDRVREEGSFDPEGLRGFDLMGKTIGVIGTGNIGKHVVRVAKGFEMNILAYDVRPDQGYAKKIGFKYSKNINDLLAKSDIITLHVPYNEHTHHMLNKDNIKNIKKGAYLINTSRGAVVETDAIIKGLKEGILSGAALDVLEEEGTMHEPLNLLMEEHPSADRIKIVLENQYLIDHSQVIITPHIAFNTKEALERIAAVSAENLKAWKEGRKINIVELKK